MPRRTAAVTAVNALAREDPDALRRYVALVRDLAAGQAKALRGRGQDELKALIARERDETQALVDRAQALLAAGGHKPSAATARRIQGLLREAALELPRQLVEGTLAAELRASGWNLPAPGRAPARRAR